LIIERYSADFIRASVENPEEFTISTAAGRMSSSAIVWAPYISRFYICGTYVLPFEMLAKHCLILMSDYK